MVKCSETAELFFLAAKIWWICVRQNIYSSRHVSKGLLIEVFTWKPQLPVENKIREENFVLEFAITSGTRLCSKKS